MLNLLQKEQNRLDLHHEIFLEMLEGKLHLAPLENPHNILDLGTGTGIWAIDMADKHPMASVVGTDLSPIQPRWVPPNCRFEVDDMEKPSTFPSDHFDFIHARNLAQSISNWPQVAADMFRYASRRGAALYFQALISAGAHAPADTSSWPSSRARCTPPRRMRQS